VDVLGAVETRTGATPSPVEVVRVHVRGCRGPSAGSGVLLGDGLILTARHVLDGAGEASIVLHSGAVVPATAVAVDRDGRDSALLHAPELARAADVAPVQLAPELPDPGSTVAVLGHPNGNAAVARSGLLLGTLDSGPLSIDGGRVMTLDLVVDPGMSGGPVVDEEGRLLGVAIGYDRATRTGIAVPVGTITDLLEGRGETPQRSC
jgi:S1-C subfamily serine protease